MTVLSGSWQQAAAGEKKWTPMSRNRLGPGSTQARPTQLSHVASLYSSTTKVLASNYRAVPRPPVVFARQGSLSPQHLVRISVCWGTPVLYQPRHWRQELTKLAESRQRQSQPNWNTLCGKWCLTPTEYCTVSKWPEFARRSTLYNR